MCIKLTEKRFTFEIKTRGNKAYIEWYDNGKPINSAETVIDLLNEQHEQIKHLKHQLKQEKQLYEKTAKELQEYKDFMGLG